MGLFINEQSWRTGAGSAEGFSKVRDPVPGTGGTVEQSNALEGKKGAGVGGT